MMNQPLYVISTFVHVTAATFWLGSMLFLSLVIIPAVRKQGDPALVPRLLHIVGPRYRRFGWVSMGILFLTGWLNLLARGIPFSVLMEPEFWQGSFGRALGWKLGLFLIVVLMSFIHDSVITPRLKNAAAGNKGHRSAAGYRRAASRLGRATLVLSLIIVFWAIVMVRGVPW